MELPNLSNPADAIKLDGMIREAVTALTKIKDLKSFLSDVANNAKETFELSPSDFNKLVSERFSDKQSDVLAKATEIVSLNEKLVNLSRNTKVSTPTQTDDQEDI
ncbi:hypothetical protein [Alishewanella phage vB_AspM_Slickus01]|nr:hypothetical protein [Alishewanella phage vB_AspM_Slicko01]WGH49835.1 hypothetical protein [Alishewanella phage vB_AspM_Slickus01]